MSDDQAAAIGLQQREVKSHQKMRIRSLIRRGVFITMGATSMAMGLEGILIPNQIIDGGITGVSMMLSHLTSINLGVYIFFLNLPFFFLGYKQIGKTFALSMLYGIIILSVATSYLHHITPFVQDVLLAVVFGGLLLGFGVGLVIRSGGVLDGTETLAILIEKKPPFLWGKLS